MSVSERVEWRVVCANGSVQPARSRLQALSMAEDADNNPLGPCGPHRVQSRTVSTSEWADTDMNA